jgi:hypothetical protein
VIAAIILARLLVPLLIPRLPLPGIVAAMLLDGVDRFVYEGAGAAHLDGYQVFDKALDIYYLTIAYASTIRNWDSGPAFQIGRVLWYYRLVGVMLFEYTDARWMLLVFPNTFEYYFLVIEAAKVTRNPFSWSANRLLAFASGLWMFVKLPQEWWLHVAELDVTDFLKEHVFQVPPDSPWIPALGNRPLGTIALGTGALGLALFVRSASRRLPAGDWAATWWADDQAVNMGWPEPPARIRPTAFFGWAFVEKVVLVTLVTLIFERILPGPNRTLLTVVVATSAIIALSSLFSHWLARRGVTWGSAAVELLVMGIANTGIAMSTAFVLSRSREHPPLFTFLFLVGLLTLIIVLFDRFTYVDRAREWPRITPDSLTRSSHSPVPL